MNRTEVQSDAIYSNARSLSTDAHEVQCSHNGDGRADDRSEEAGSKEAVNGVDAELRNMSERRDNPNVPDSADGGLRQMGDGDAVETARSGQSHARDFNTLHQSDYLKKAKLVNFVITARVVVDDTATETEIAETALDKIYKDIHGYLTPECLEDVFDDTECPYKNDMEEAAPYFFHTDEY